MLEQTSVRTSIRSICSRRSRKTIQKGDGSKACTYIVPSMVIVPSFGMSSYRADNCSCMYTFTSGGGGGGGGKLFISGCDDAIKLGSLSGNRAFHGMSAESNDDSSF